MAILRRKRSQMLEQPSSTSSTPPISASSSNVTLNRFKLQTDVASSSHPSNTSPASSIDSGKNSFFQTHMPRAIRSLSRSSTASSRLSAGPAPDSPGSTRSVLRKSHKRVPSGHDLLSRRGSNGSDVISRISRASTNMSGSSSSNFIDWRVQAIEKHAPVEYVDHHTARLKAGYMIITADFLLLFRTPTDAIAAFPSLADLVTVAPGANGSKFSSMLPPSDPLHVVPFHSVISAFREDSVRSRVGIEIWWTLSYPAIATNCARIFLDNVRSRESQLDTIAAAVKAKRHEQPEAFRVGCEVEDCIRRIFRVEESNYASGEPEIFPVVYRNAPERLRSKADDKPKKGQPEGTHSHYLAVGINLCFLIEIGRASITQSTALEVRYQTCGLVTLELFRAKWTPRDERFSMVLRDPFKSPIALHLASQNYRQIILTLAKADKFLKPAWPTPWQTQNVFKVVGLPVYQQIAAGEDFGGFQRTLTAFCAGYRCDPVDWEINWRTTIAPEFRVLPPAKGVPYTALQLVAVLRALRYNDYFKSLSFRDVDLSNLLDKYDVSRISDEDYVGNVASMNRNGVGLTSQEKALLQKASLMHQEFHALAFASGKIRQIDFTNSLRAASQAHRTLQTVQFLVPILNLLAAGLTRCNRLLLSGCSLGAADMESLVSYIAPSLSARAQPKSTQLEEAVGLEALDVSNCSLSEDAMKALFGALSHSAWTLEELDVSQNLGRVPATMIQSFMESVGNLRHLNLSSSLSGSFEGELLPLESLNRLDRLEHLDISNFKLNETSLGALEGFLATLSARRTSQYGQDSGPYSSPLRQLVLNNCGITGRGAGRIFGAIAGLYDIHLYLNSNPLEVGIDDFVLSLNQCWGGRFGLHMDMVEFQDEDNYAELINAITANPFIYYLSLVGTAPMPTTDGTCSEQTCAVLERFFRENQSVCYLDLSGFCSKLDDGQLGKNFGRALRGLADNKTLTHLRIRNQNLHDSTGILGAVIQSNTALRYLDCGDNDFNLTSQRFMAKSLEANNTLLMYAAVTQDDVNQVLQACLKDMPAHAPPASSSKQKKAAADAAFENQKALFREEIEAATAEILSYTSRNMTNLEQATGCLLEVDEAIDAGGAKGWPSLQLVMPEGMVYASPMKGPFEDEENGPGQAAGPTQTDEQLQKVLETAPPAQEPPAARQSLLSSALHAPLKLEETPYRVHQDDAVLHSPITATGPGWDMPEPDGLMMKATGRKGVVNGVANGVVDGEFTEKAFFSEPEVARILESLSMDDASGIVICGHT